MLSFIHQRTLLFLCVSLAITAVVGLRLDPSDTSFWNYAVRKLTAGDTADGPASKGYVHPALSILPVEPHLGVSLVTLKDLPAYTSIIKIPEHLTIESTNIDNLFPAWKALFPSGENILSSTGLYLAYLKSHYDSLVEEHISKGHKFNDYIHDFLSLPLVMQLTPNDCFNGLYINSSVDLFMKEDRAHSFYQDQEAVMAELWTKFDTMRSTGGFRDGHNISAITYEHLLWGMCIVSSRSFYSSRDNGCVLIPVGDLVNHARYYNIQWSYREDEHIWVWKTVRAVKAGEELLASYGSRRENLDLMYEYGFVLDNNHYDEHYVLHLPLQPPFSFLYDKYPDNQRSWLRLTERDNITYTDLLFIRVALLPPNMQTAYHLSHLLSNTTYPSLDIIVFEYLLTQFELLYIEIQGPSIESDRIGLQKSWDRLTACYTAAGTSPSRRQRCLFWKKRSLVYHYAVERKESLQRGIQWIKQQLEESKKLLK